LSVGQLFTVPPESALRQDSAASSGAIIANTRIPAITHAAILFALLLLKFIQFLLDGFQIKVNYNV
jgi:hypothetical protein